MAGLKRPGVYVEESLVQTNPDFFPSASSAAFVGVASRGPTTPTFVDSWLMYQRIFGGFAGSNQALAHAVYQFYNNGGRNAWIVRAVGTGAVVATRTLNDRAGAPAPVMRVDADNAGVWGNSIYVEITDATAGRFNLIVRLGGSSDQYIVERWLDLSGDPNDPRYAPALINSASAGSSYITVTDLYNHAGGGYTAATHIPALTPAGGSVLATGADGAAPTGGAAGQTYTAVTQLSSVEEFLTLNVPEITETALVNAIVAYAESRGNIFVVVDCGADRTPAQVITDAAAYTASGYAAVYYPRLQVADPSGAVPGATRLIAPGGAVLGQIAAIDAARGVHKAPAGIGARLNGVVALETRPLDSELDNLQVAQVNAIKSIPGVGYCIFGARTRKQNQIDRYVSVRRTLISVRMALVDATRFAAFEPNDETLWASLESVCERILIELWQEKGLRGATPEEAFYVKCDADTNTNQSISNGEVRIEVGLALQTPAEYIVLKIGQFETGSTVTEEA